MTNDDRKGATRLIAGVEHFRKLAYPEQADLFQRLGEGQRPGTLFITCSDSRIDPNLLTGTKPGDIFVLRNAGNIVPPAGVPSGEEATVEYGLACLGIRDIIVCGHSKCGAMAGLLNPNAVAPLPAVRRWLEHAGGVAEEAARRQPDLPASQRLPLAIELNVLRQLDNLRTHPAVARAVAEGRVRLHAWVYQFEVGAVTAFDGRRKVFVPLAEAEKPALAALHSAGA